MRQEEHSERVHIALTSFLACIIKMIEDIHVGAINIQTNYPDKELLDRVCRYSIKATKSAMIDKVTRQGSQLIKDIAITQNKIDNILDVVDENLEEILKPKHELKEEEVIDEVRQILKRFKI